MKRRIAVFTGTRAEYGLLRPVLQTLQTMPEIDTLLLVGGSHFSASHGHTLDDILVDGFVPTAQIPLSLDDDSPQDTCCALSQTVQGVGEALANLKPDMLLLLGDRYETLGAATAATLHTVPVAHIHGGEETQGAVDDSFRHALTKMSHLHFTSCEAHRQRVIQLGESPERVFNVGALGVENALTLPLLSETAIRGHLGIGTTQPYIMCTFHPVTREQGEEQKQMRMLLGAVNEFPDYTVIFTGANADSGGGRINHILQEQTTAQPKRFRFFLSLGTARYLTAAKYAACVMGNSSSGIIEVPSMGTPVVDIGDRQKGRMRSNAVLHADVDGMSLKHALQKALAPEYREAIRCMENPYEKPAVAASIVHHIGAYPLDGILKKTFYDFVL